MCKLHKIAKYKIKRSYCKIVLWIVECHQKTSENIRKFKKLLNSKTLKN